MLQEIYEISKYLISAAVGAGLTVAIIAKFGESLFFKHLDHKYAERLAQKNIQLQKELEATKNTLNLSLQQDVARYKADLEVLSGQRSRFLERQIDSILEVNKFYVNAIQNLNEFINTNHSYIEEAASFFISQAEEDGVTEFSDYSVYEKIHREHWPKKQLPAENAIDDYAGVLALKLPILPKEFASTELATVSELQECMEQSKLLFYRAMGLTMEIIEPEEGMTPEECIVEFKEHVRLSLKRKEQVVKYANDLLGKAQNSSVLIETLLQS